ncbi:MAG: hypothetical protein RBT55_05325 [Rhodocyclaceae bacterium]|jgi:hypothetical protein|nr:hypothetical protein [Rhodocyclaceae bacterium]
MSRQSSAADSASPSSAQEEDVLSIPPDELSALASAEVQKRAARMAQDAFSEVFRLTLSEDDAGRARGVARLCDQLDNWARAGNEDGIGEDGSALRRAMVLAGLDQWGVAYSRAFGLQAIPGLTELVGGLRTRLDVRDDARFQRQFAALEEGEGNAIDFKIDLRRSLHLALWHAMIACDERDQATAILSQLGGMLFVLVRSMPQLGWRLVADTLANIQIQCIAHGLAADGLGREMTVSLFAALNQELPAEHRDRVMAYANQSVLAWKQASVNASGQVH